MSIDPYGILYYGFPLIADDDSKTEYQEPDGWYELNEAWEHENGPKRLEDKDYKSPAWDEWRKRYREWRKDPRSIEVTYSGADSCQRYYVHSQGLEHKVTWDEQTEIAPNLLALKQIAADESIKRFCEKAGIEYRQPAWYLAAKYQ